MNQHTELNRCRVQGKEAEREAIVAAIERRQRKHKRVTVLQAELQVVAHEILKMGLNNG